MSLINVHKSACTADKLALWYYRRCAASLFVPCRNNRQSLTILGILPDRCVRSPPTGDGKRFRGANQPGRRRLYMVSPSWCRRVQGDIAGVASVPHSNTVPTWLSCPSTQKIRSVNWNARYQSSAHDELAAASVPMASIPKLSSFLALTVSWATRLPHLILE